MIWHQKFLKFLLSGFSTSCVDEVILVEIVISGSQFITKIDQIFYILMDLIFFKNFFVLCFCFKVILI